MLNPEKIDLTGYRLIRTVFGYGFSFLITEHINKDKALPGPEWICYTDNSGNGLEQCVPLSAIVRQFEIRDDDNNIVDVSGSTLRPGSTKA